MWHPNSVRRRAESGDDDPTINRDTAQRLLDRAPDAAREHAELIALLAAAAGPAQSHELAGEQDALAGFVRDYRPHPNPRTAGSRPGPRVGATVAVSVAALLLGGTAYAAGTGRLPDALRDFLPATAAPTSAHPSPTSRTDPRPARTTPTLNPSTGPAPQPSGTEPVDAARLVSLCQSWAAFRADPHTKPVNAEERHTLALAAGGENAINAFCEQRLNPTPEPSATTTKPGNPDPGAGKPSNPGKSPPH